MVKFQAIVDGKVIAEGDTISNAIKNAEDQGYTREQIQIRSVREVPKV